MTFPQKYPAFSQLKQKKSHGMFERKYADASSIRRSQIEIEA